MSKTNFQKIQNKTQKPRIHKNANAPKMISKNVKRNQNEYNKTNSIGILENSIISKCIIKTTK